MNNKIIQTLGIMGFITLAGFIAYSLAGGRPEQNKEPSPTEPINNQTTHTNTMSERQIAILQTTAGRIEIELSAETPKTSGNFVKLAQARFYDGTIFHRVLRGFMIQGGDPNTKQPESATNIYGTGGPGYKFADEPFTGEYTRGAVAMANSGPNTNGSQFFIMHGDYALPHNYVIFGHVISGMDVVDKIASAPVTVNSLSGESSKPISPIKISSIAIATMPNQNLTK